MAPACNCNRVRGGPVQVLHTPASGDVGRIGQIIAEFVDGCVLPAATAASVHCTQPAFGPRTAVTAAAEMLFSRFADTADGEWPLTNQAEGLWDELVSGCLTEQVAIDRAELSQWLEHSGWDRDAATALTDRFFADSEWLAKRLAVDAAMTSLAQAAADLTQTPRPILFLDTCTLLDIVRAPLRDWTPAVRGRRAPGWRRTGRFDCLFRTSYPGVGREPAGRAAGR